MSDIPLASPRPEALTAPCPPPARRWADEPDLSYAIMNRSRKYFQADPTSATTHADIALVPPSDASGATPTVALSHAGRAPHPASTFSLSPSSAFVRRDKAPETKHASEAKQEVKQVLEPVARPGSGTSSCTKQKQPEEMLARMAQLYVQGAAIDARYRSETARMNHELARVYSELAELRIDLGRDHGVFFPADHKFPTAPVPPTPLATTPAPPVPQWHTRSPFRGRGGYRGNRNPRR